MMPSLRYYLLIISIQFVCIQSKPDLCISPSNINGIAYIDSMRIRWALTKSGFYWLLREHELPTSDRAVQLPYNLKGGAIAVKDVFECEDPEEDEFSIIFVELVDNKLQYVSYNIDSGNMSNLEVLKNDVVFGNADIDYAKNLDSMFNGIAGQIFFIQGDSYAEILLETETCPKSKDSVISHKARSLKDLSIKSPIDASYFIETESKLYLFKQDIVYQIKLDSKSLMHGVLNAVNIKQSHIEDLFQDNLTFGCKPRSSTQFMTTDIENTQSSSVTTDPFVPSDDSGTLSVVLFISFLFIVIVIVWFTFICYVCYTKDNKMEKLPNYSKYKIESFERDESVK